VWRERLERLAEVLPLEESDAAEALRREINGIPPARRDGSAKAGTGARDAAIWLAVRRDHRRRGEEGHLISSDADFGEQGQLHRALAAELGELAPIRLYKGIRPFLDRLGRPEPDPTIDIDVLARRVAPTLDEALRFTTDVPKALLDKFDPRQQYTTKVSRAEPVRVITAQRYVGGEEAVSVVDAEWRLDVDLMVPGERIMSTKGSARPGACTNR
jgi:hypothetical protein